MNVMHQLTTQDEVRESFWEAHPQFQRGPKSKRQNAYPCDTRMAFCDWVEYLNRVQIISDAMARRVTL